MSGLRTVVKAGAAALDVVRPGGAGVVVLIYHRVGGRTPTVVDLPPGLFEEQMAELAEQHRVVTLDDAVEMLGEGTVPDGATVPAGDCVVVTFDDGTADFAETAVPIMARHGIPATLYVATEFVERGIDFPDEGRPVSWSALRDCLAGGLVTIGSHTHTHALLDRAPAADVADELDRSIGLIGDRLGVEARHFAYPKALPGSPEADAAVRARFASAAVAGTHRNPYRGTDVHALARSPLQVSDGMRWFRHKVDGGMRAEDTLRRLVNRRRYAGATT